MPGVGADDKDSDSGMLKSEGNLEGWGDGSARQSLSAPSSRLRGLGFLLEGSERERQQN